MGLNIFSKAYKNDLMDVRPDSKGQHVSDLLQ